MSKNKNISNDASNNERGADDSLQKRNLPVSSLQRALDYGYSKTNEKNVFDYAALFSRHWFLILAFVVIGVSYAAYYNNVAQKIYRSSALVNIGTYVPPVDGPTGDTLRSETLKSNYISTQARLLKSFTLAEKSLRSNPSIRSKFDGEFAKTQNSKSPIAVSVMDSYLSTIIFDTIPNTTLVQVHAHTNDSKLSAEIANAHVKAFIELVRERTKDAAYTNLNYLKEKLAEANKKVEAVEKKRLAYIKENKLNIIGTEMTDQVFTQKHNGLVQSLSSAINERNSAESDFLTARSMHGLDEQITYQTLEVAKLESELSNYLSDGGSRFSQVYNNISKQIKALKAGIKAYGKQKLDLAREKYSSSTSKERRLNEEFEKLNNEQLNKAKHKAAYDTLKQEVATQKEVQKAIAKRLEEALVNIENNQDTVAIVDQAYASAFPVSPNIRSNLWKGCLAGLLLGLLAAFLLDFANNKVHSVSDLQQVMSTPILGVVPQFSKEVLKLNKTFQQRVKSDEEKANDNSFAPTSPVPLISAPFSIESESVRGILATLTAPSSSNIPHSILVTSGQKSDGKTTIALNLAAALAQVGEKTLLIDADLRLSSVHKYFKIDNGNKGLVDCLSQKVDPASVIANSGVENLHILLPGSPCSNPAMLLKSDQMGELLEMLKAEYDFVIIDSPPIGPVADSLLLARHVDGVVMVVRSGETSKALAESAVSRLRQVGSKILGIVLNDATAGQGYFQSRYSRSGYGYGYHHYNKSTQNRKEA